MLSDFDREFFDQHGYLVVKQLVPRERVDAVLDAIWEFLEFDRDDPSDWYREPHRVNGMVEMYHHQALWDVRQQPAVYELFQDLFDRANLKPPPNAAHPEYDHHGMVHWDMDVRETPTPFQVQGVLYLVDTRRGEGGFQCVPGAHRRAAQISAGISNEDLRHQQLHERFATTLGPPIEIEADAGDFIIWHSALPHGNSRNRSDKPRLAQYVRLIPADPADEALREARIASWRERTHPAFQNPRAFPGDPRGKEAQSEPAELTSLGRKLLGLDDWD